MKFTFYHTNINVMDLEKSVDFYKKALGLKETRRREAEDGSFILVFMGDQTTEHGLELTWLRDRKEPYDLEDNEIHVAFKADDLEAARKHHREMGCICYENLKLGIYFIEDPDGYWVEIVPAKR